MLMIFINIRHHNFNYNFIISDCQGPKSHTSYYSAIKDWNSLPEKLKTIQDNKKFKFELNKFLQLHNQRMKLYTCIINRWTQWHLCRDM